MTMHGVCGSIREARERLARRIHRFIPCLADPGRRASVGLKVALVAIHLVFISVLFLFDGDLINATRRNPWYTVIYLLLFAATLAQYFYTSCSSPGYVLEAMRSMEEIQIKASKNFRQSALSKDGSHSNTVDSRQSGWNYSELNATAWMKLVMDMYPPGSQSRNWTCVYCNLLQPPRAKHCHDCDKCVLQFDHHCVWLGTCIGQGNHCRFWWYILEETALCIWTGVLYITYLRTNISAEWWKDVIMILLLGVLSISLVFLLLLLFFHSYLVLTNQTTYELVRRRRIPYLRGMPDRVYPFNDGICKNLFNFCCSCNGGYVLEAVPTAEDIEAQARPYTCWDVMACRCC
ncbi:unnamed protein product [Victoria cruziana]